MTGGRGRSARLAGWPRSVLALVAVLAVLALTACSSRPLYVFPTLPPALPAGTTNLLSDPSFETDQVICTTNCNAASGWSIEHSTPSPPQYRRVSDRGVVTGQYAEELVYAGQPADNGKHKDIELYHGAADPSTVGGRTLTFTLWVSGSCQKCAPFIGIESFDPGNHYLGESDQYFHPPTTPRAVQVSYTLPATTVVVAAYIQVPELYSESKLDLVVDDASLVADASGPSPAPATAS